MGDTGPYTPPSNDAEWQAMEDAQKAEWQLREQIEMEERRRRLQNEHGLGF